jgi:AAA15 family ATPase/GTPase
MITELHIRNFKSVKAVDLKCSRINVFIGEPNTGKSNILETIALLHLFVDRYRKFTRSDLSFIFRISQWNQLFHWRDLSQAISLDAVVNSEHSIQLKLQYDESINWIGVVHGDNEITALDPNELDYDLALEKDGIVRFGFYRFRSRNVYRSREDRFVVPPDAPNLLEVVRTSGRELVIALSNLFSKYGLALVLEMPSGSIKLQHSIGEENIPIVASLPYSLLSDTLQRMVFNLAIILGNKKMVIALEEPETHTFPVYVKYLAEKIARDKNDNQYFISTHNPYFLISLLEKAPKKDVNVFITSLENYETKVRMLTDEQKVEILDMGSDVFFNLDKIWEELGLEVEK